MASHVDSTQTSPDPLANSLDHETDAASRIKRADSDSPKKPLGRTHSNIKLQDFYLDTPPASLIRSSSPTKSIAQTQNLVSPWRIRVTVEAERDENGQEGPDAAGSPTTRLAQRTTTTTVPLKNADDSTPALAKRGRGRPRKSIDGPIKRKGTPKPVRPVRPKENVGYLEYTEELSDCGPDTTPLQRLRGRPRKSLEADMDKISPITEEAMGLVDTPGSISHRKSVMMGTGGQRRAKGRRKAIPPQKTATSSDLSINTNNMTFDTHDGQIPDEFKKGAKLQKLSAPLSIATTNQGIHRGHSIFDSGESSIRNAGSLGDDIGRPSRHLQSLPSPEQSISSPDIEMQSHHVQRNDQNPDHTKEYNGYDSIIESEGFSMVSVSTLPSAKQHLNTSPRPKHSSAGTPQTQSIQSKVQVPKSITCVPTEFSRNNSPRKGHQRVSTRSPTFQPITAQRSPVLSSVKSSSGKGNSECSHQNMEGQTRLREFPSPIRPPSLNATLPRKSTHSVDKPTQDTPKLPQIVRAGIALQGVLSPRPPISNDHSSESHMGTKSASNGNTSKERLDDLFSGFGASTRRELKAGLRLGEELAKRQRLNAQATNASRTYTDYVLQDETSSKYPKLPTPDRGDVDSHSLPRSQTQVLYPELPTQHLPGPERSQEDFHDDQMSWKADTPMRAIQDTDVDVQLPSFTANVNHIVDDTMLQREAEWQREREVISKQIQEANTSQVIVINSDEERGDGSREEDDKEEEQDDDDVDIWQSEALSSHKHLPASMKAPEAQARCQFAKPHRSKLPSPWRKHSQVVYSDEVAPTEDDLFWPSDLATPKITPVRKETKKVRHDPSDFSALSDFTGFVPDDESSMLRGVVSPRISRDTVNPEAEDEKRDEINEGKDGEDGEDGEDGGDGGDGGDGKDGEDGEVRKGSKEDERNRDHEGEMDLDGPKSTNDKPKKRTRRVTVVEESTEVEVTTKVHSLIIPQNGTNTAFISQQQSISSDTASTTWFHRIASFVPSFQSLVPGATAQSKSQTAGPKGKRPTPTSTEPLSIYTPWTDAHYRALRYFYLTCEEDPDSYPYNPTKPSAYLLRRRIIDRPYQHRIEKWELGLAEAFLDMLDAEGIDDWIAGVDKEGNRPGERMLIDEQEVVVRLFSLWVGEEKDRMAEAKRAVEGKSEGGLKRKQGPGECGRRKRQRNVE